MAQYSKCRGSAVRNFSDPSADPPIEPYLAYFYGHNNTKAVLDWIAANNASAPALSSPSQV
jgi:hypothetical protein